MWQRTERKVTQYLVGEFAGKLSSLLEQLLVFLWAVWVEDWYEILKKMKNETKNVNLESFATSLLESVK